MKQRSIFTSLVLFSFAFAGVALSADSKLEQALRDLDTQWSAAAAAKNLDKTVSFYSEDAIVLPPNAAAATTKDAIRNVWKDAFATTTSLSWKATRVEIAKSGDMAYVSGTYEATGKDPTGKPFSEHGKYLEVWEKQADGSWKCGADSWNSDLPVAASAEKK